MIYGVPGQQEGGNPLGDPLQVSDIQQTHHTLCAGQHVSHRTVSKCFNILFDHIIRKLFMDKRRQ